MGPEAVVSIEGCGKTRGVLSAGPVGDPLWTELQRPVDLNLSNFLDLKKVGEKRCFLKILFGR